MRLQIVNGDFPAHEQPQENGGWLWDFGIPGRVTPRLPAGDSDGGRYFELRRPELGKGGAELGWGHVATSAGVESINQPHVSGISVLPPSQPVGDYDAPAGRNNHFVSSIIRRLKNAPGYLHRWRHHRLNPHRSTDTRPNRPIGQYVPLSRIVTAGGVAT